MATARHFTLQLSSTPRGARLARLLAVEQVRAWGLEDSIGAAEQVVAELASNAVTHGHVPGRDFRLRVIATGAALRIEVTDTRGDRVPVTGGHDGSGEGGRGLLIVEALSRGWGVRPGPAPQKTVWAEIPLP
ncbi:ATP-binding protein [Streptomyces sp. NPDC058486]